MSKARLFPLALAVTLALVTLVLPRTAHAQAQPDDAAYRSAVFLLEQTTTPYADARHNQMLRGLRQLNDPELRPLFEALSASPHAAQRIHGRLGLAGVSADREIDLRTLAEYQDTPELTEVLSAALDDGLIGNESLATLIQWQDVRLGIRLSAALHLIGQGGRVAPDVFRPALDHELGETTPATDLLEFALAAVVLAEMGDPAGPAALDRVASYTGPNAEAVIGSVFVTALKYDKMKSPIKLALTIAADDQRSKSLRLSALRFALRRQAQGAEDAWRKGYAEQTETAWRIRYASVALDALPNPSPELFTPLLKDAEPLVQAMGQAGIALASDQPDLPKAIAPLLAQGYPSTWDIVTTYCKRTEHEQSAALFETLIRHHDAGEPRVRALVGAAVANAIQAYCELLPEQAAERLPILLKELSANEKIAGRTRLLILAGALRVREIDLLPLVRAIPPTDASDLTNESLHLLLRARFGDTLTAANWLRIGDLVQGVGQMDYELRVQLAWLYITKLGKQKEAIRQALQ